MNRRVNELKFPVPAAWGPFKLPTNHGTTALRIDVGEQDDQITLQVSYRDPKTGEKLTNSGDGMTERAVDLLVERGEKTMVGWVAKQIILRIDSA